jgi:hypothetical protein
MRAFLRPVVTAFSIACLAASAAAVTAGSALAQNKMAPAPAQAAAPAQEPALKQIALTDKQIEGVISAQKDMDAITSKLPQDAKPDPKVLAQLEGVAKKYGFANYDEYNTVMDNISLVMAGFDPATKKYVGTEAVIKSQIALVEADKKMSAKEKKEVLDDLNTALKQPEIPVQNKANIDIVGKYFDKLATIMGEDQN